MVAVVAAEVAARTDAQAVADGVVAASVVAAEVTAGLAVVAAAAAGATPCWLGSSSSRGSGRVATAVAVSCGGDMMDYLHYQMQCSVFDSIR